MMRLLGSIYTWTGLSILILSIGIINSYAYADVNKSGVSIKWGYKGNLGPIYWGKLDPSFILCATGKSQSPVSIPKKVKTVTDNLKINYRAAPSGIIENGITHLMIGNTQTLINDGHSVQLNFSAQSKESITWAGKTYRLVQFHFHSPSETLLHKEAFPLEIHFVHQSDDGQLLVISVLVENGKANAVLQNIVNHLPTDQGIEHAIPGDNINPFDLLPVKQDHYSFDGSLTTPPCTQGVQWIVMAQAMTASSAQIVRLRREMGGMNARPAQPLNGRIISYTPAK